METYRKLVCSSDIFDIHIPHLCFRYIHMRTHMSLLRPKHRYQTALYSSSCPKHCLFTGMWLLFKDAHSMSDFWETRTKKVIVLLIEVWSLTGNGTYVKLSVVAKQGPQRRLRTPPASAALSAGGSADRHPHITHRHVTQTASEETQGWHSSSCVFHHCGFVAGLATRPLTAAMTPVHGVSCLQKRSRSSLVGTLSRSRHATLT